MHIKAVRGLFQASSKIVKLTFEQPSGAFSIKVYLQEEHTYTTFNVRAQYGASTLGLPFPPPLPTSPSHIPLVLGSYFARNLRVRFLQDPVVYIISIFFQGEIKWTWRIVTEEECTTTLNHHILSVANQIPDLDIMKWDAYPFKHLIPKKIQHCNPVKESMPKWDKKENFTSTGLKKEHHGKYKSKT